MTRGTAVEFIERLFNSCWWRGPTYFLRRFFLALWICRISVFSVALGLLLFSAAPQARDLFRDVSGGLGANGLEISEWRMLGNTLSFLVFLVLFWIVPVHGMARWSLERYDRVQPDIDRNAQPVATRVPFRWMPFILGCTCLLVVWNGLRVASHERFDPLPIATEQLVRTQLDYLEQGIFVVLVLYLAYVTGYSNRSRAQTVTNRVSRATRTYSRLLAISITVLLIPIILFPNGFVVDYRLQLVPLVLGAWVPLLSWLSSCSYYPLRLPVLAIGAVIVLTFLYLHEGHDVRTVAAGSAPTNLLLPIDLDVAVSRWREANGCSDSMDKCPNPIVVAAAGGASRAAFLAASVLGFFMDETCPTAPTPSPQQRPSEKPAGCSDTPIFARRVFAISSVSGGALGAGVFAAMLREHQGHKLPTGEPCRKASSFWFRTTPPKGWRECLQAVLAADFLSPAVIGLAFRDNVALLNWVFPQFFGDRASLLEDAWSDNFRKLVLDDSLPADQASARGLDAAFDEFGPQAAGTWRPLLVMNGTSTASGRCILASQLFMGGPDRPLFSDAYELRNLINDGVQGQGKARTVSLATAITSSARFPIVSPPGVIHDGRDRVVDRIVDGGYFENNGITTVNDIVLALLAKGLKPAILQLTNDPISVERVHQLDAHPNSVPLLPEAKPGLVAAGLAAPFLALYNTRSARADLVIIRAGESTVYAGHMVPVAHVTVYGEPVDGAITDGKQERPVPFRDVSMSWWMSKPMQEYIDTQLFDDNLSRGEQKSMLQRVCGWLQRPNGADADLKQRCNDGVERAFNRPSMVKAAP